MKLEYNGKIYEDFDELEDDLICSDKIQAYESTQYFIGEEYIGNDVDSDIVDILLRVPGVTKHE